MADELKTEGAVETPNAASALVEKLDGMATGLASLEKSFTEMDAKIEARSKVEAPAWMSGTHGIVSGESALASRPFSYSRLAMGLAKMNANDESWKEQSKLEVEFSAQLAKRLGFGAGRMAVPIGADYMSEENGLSDLRKEWSDMDTNLKGFDKDEMQWMVGQLNKSMSFRTNTSGGTLVDFPAQGELIDLLRNTSVFGQIPGISNVQLPQQGSIRYPRITSGVTVSSYAELETTSESTIGTDDVRMEARKYAGLVKMSEEFMKFVTSVSADAFIRGEMTQDINLQVDSDIVAGGGGNRIQGLVNYANITTHAASTPGATGDTLEPRDIEILLAKMADSNAPVDRGVFVVLRNRLWASLKYREDTNGRPKFQASAQAYGGGRVQQMIGGNPVYTSTNIPNTRAETSATDLTLVLAGVASELYLGRAGAMEIMMTNSDSTDFQVGKYTLRGVHFVDAVPKHEESFGLIDQLLQS
jgi:HK97 family phage major capsid protein